MIHGKRCALGAALACIFMVPSSHALVGIGGHYGVDLSMNIDDAVDEAATFDSLKVSIAPTSIGGTAPTGLPYSYVTGEDLPIYISRTGWESKLSAGGKLYVDIIPVLDAVEASSNIGMWEYTGVIKYPSSMDWNPSVTTYSTALSPESLFVPVYQEQYLTLDSLSGEGFMGLHQTPYAKIHFDLTIRKNVLALPPIVNILKLYAGGGMSMHFATPALSVELIQDTLATELNTTKTVPELGSDLFGNPVIMQKVTDKIISEFMTPHFGMHIVIGAHVKPPVVPLGIYIDGKFMIPFGAFDDHVEVGGTGLLLNMGVTLGI